MLDFCCWCQTCACCVCLFACLRLSECCKYRARCVFAACCACPSAFSLIKNRFIAKYVYIYYIYAHMYMYTNYVLFMCMCIYILNIYIYIYILRGEIYWCPIEKLLDHVEWLFKPFSGRVGTGRLKRRVLAALDLLQRNPHWECQQPAISAVGDEQ